MKRVILLICIAAICFSLSGCEHFGYIFVEKYMPHNYPGSVWKCDDPEIEYAVDDKGSAVAITETDGKTVEFVIAEEDFRVKAFPYDSTNKDEYGNTVIDAEAILFSGRITYSKDKFRIKIDKSTDTLFDGQYRTLTFRRCD